MQVTAILPFQLVAVLPCSGEAICMPHHAFPCRYLVNPSKPQTSVSQGCNSSKAKTYMYVNAGAPLPELL